MILHAIQRKKVFLTLKKQGEDVERIDSVSVKYMQSIVHLILFLYKFHLIFFSRDFDSSNILASFLSVLMNTFTVGKRLKFDVCEK